MANRVVYERPYDSEIEYLESGNTQFIDTGIIATNNTNFKLKVYTDSKQRQILGQYEAVNNNYLAFGVYYFNNSNKLVLYGVNSTYLSTRIGISGRLVEMKLHDNQFTIDSYAFNVTRNNIIKNKTLYLFKMNGLEITPNSHLKMYYCKIWNGDTLVRDFIPVRRGSVGYMYDRVSGKLFGNKGTNNFILGQDVSNPVPNIRRVFRFGNKRFVMPMPYDSKVEYLETDGNQYIDTGVYGSNNSKIELDLQLLELGASKAIFGCYTSTNNGLYIYQAGGNGVGKWQFGFGWNANVGTTDTNRHFFVFDNFKVKIDGTIILSATPRDFTTTQTLLMFNMHNNSGGIYSATGMRIFSCKLYNRGTLIRDFIPVRRGDVGYLYDKVSGKLFGNAGTGQFILGNDIND